MARPSYADVRVQSVIHFWCWFAPMALCASALVIVPVGAWFGFQIYKSSVPAYYMQAGPALYASLTGAFIALVLCIVAAIWSYFKNRPNVKVEITPEFIRYGDMLFDRQFEDGMTIGYQTGEAELKANITDKKFGVTRLRLRYGSWGEDLKYMVNSYYAAEIVIFLNDVIGGVGAEEETGDNADKGQKTELL